MRATWAWASLPPLLLGAALAAPPREEEQAPASDFAGAASCVACHASEARAWRDSPHARHATALAEPPGGADAAVGSRWMQAYLRRDAQGYHRILPDCFDLRTGQWVAVDAVLDAIRGDPSGWPPVPHVALAGRSFEIDCSGCHASRAELALDPASGGMRARWDDAAIDCEACHGPGAAHAEAWARRDSSVPMPRLEKLSPREQNAICARCHGGPPTAAEFQPSDAGAYIASLDDRIGFFPDGAASGQVYQIAAFARSPCTLEAGLTCADCHDPHGPGLRPAPHADAQCTRCHEEKAGRAHTFHDPRGEGARCVSCHMPRLLSGIMAHQRDHRIGIPLPQSPHAPDACTACHADQSKEWASEAWGRWWGEPPAATLEAILANRLARDANPGATPLLRRALTHPDPFFRANAAISLRDPASLFDDPVPEVRLAGVRAAAHGSDPERDLQRWLGDTEPRVRAAALIERLRLGHPLEPRYRDDLALAARHLRDLPEARVALGVWNLQEERPLEALRAFQGALAFRPGQCDAWLGLATALTQLGRTDEALQASARRAELLAAASTRNPADAVLAVEAASACIVAGLRDRAGDLLRGAAGRQPPGATRTALFAMLERLAKEGP
ncbi:MAG: tetratricopeptide repeat protein [Planctomycetaceae bacterium]